MEGIDYNNISRKEIPEKRLSICKECPLYSIRYGGLCNDRLWLNVETGEISEKVKSGYVRGCGCVLAPKVENIASICPAGKW